VPESFQAFRERYRYPGHPDWVRPAYGGDCVTNLLQSLLAYFGADHGAVLREHAALAAALGGRRKIVLLILDGLGWRNLERAVAARPIIGEQLAGALRMPLTSVFPSTTSAAMTSLLYGLQPCEHGVIGFLMYLPRYGRVFNMLNFHSPDAENADLLSLGFRPDAYVGRANILRRLADVGVLARGYTLLPYVSSGLSGLIYAGTRPHAYVALGDLLAAALGQLPAALPQLHLLYWSSLDTIAHASGAGSDGYHRELQVLVTTLRDQVIAALDDDTALLVCADHGHIDGDDGEAINLSAHPELTRLFRVPPAGEGRATRLFLKPGTISEATHCLREIGGMTVLTRDQGRALLGDAPPRADLDDSLGDLLVLPHGSRRTLYAYQPRPHTAMIGRHGGLSPDEMIVPLLVFTQPS